MSLTLFFIFLAASAAAASTGVLFPTGEWYKSLRKPAWTPPNWAFPVVWITIYLLIAFAGARVAMVPGAGLAMAFWAAQIALNAVWTPVFFGLRHWRASQVVVVCLWVAVLGALVTHIMIDLWAGLAFVPYLLWVTVAVALNRKVVTLNPGQKPLEIHKL
ncbi:tryptophan-rich sensory protein [Salipiger sp. IMCC34102]|uniref:tryptophan-rich sensory protein TspO n=1 Tax=Salipiger sp. IMCC34102 TaxID=2510647 RepID=UPI00101DD170|nr:TspO/MBR family protein [Salipiger sp. IMCC34102]RYH01697.1 tryptophan-rich sensory protein [Salipiger sp. IMCC34102]